MKIRNTVYVVIGVISVCLGIIGIFIPGLPTTPFLLLSSWLFYKSSKRLHNALHRTPWLSRYIRRFEEKRGVSRLSKLISIACMWTMISISAFCFFESEYARIILFGLGIIGTLSVLFIVPTAIKK